MEKLLNLLYPRVCCFCGEINKKGVCSSCIEKIVYIKESRCKRCGRPVRYEEQEFCHECDGKEFYYEQGRSIWLHREPVSSSIYQFKYHNRRVYGKFYAEEMYRLFEKEIKEWEIDVIIPVPLHKKKQRIRGYNQAEVMAKHLGHLTGIFVDTKLVQRKRDTKPQKELGNKGRKQNLQDAFCISSDLIYYRSALLIDDIYTTGSTIDAVAGVLKKKGVSRVWFLSISIGQDF